MPPRENQLPWTRPGKNLNVATVPDRLHIASRHWLLQLVHAWHKVTVDLGGERNVEIYTTVKHFLGLGLQTLGGRHGADVGLQGRSPKLTWVDDFFVSKRTPALAATGGPCPSRCPRDTVEISRVQRCSGSTTAFGSPDLSESLPVRATHRRELLRAPLCVTAALESSSSRTPGCCVEHSVQANVSVDPV